MSAEVLGAIHTEGKPMLASLEFFQLCPVRSAPFYGRVKVVSLRDLHHAQTFRFPLVADKSAASALHPAL